MPKQPPDPRHVEIQAVRRGELIVVPVQRGVGVVRESAPSHGIYVKPAMAEHGYFIDSRRLFEELDKTLDF